VGLTQASPTTKELFSFVSLVLCTFVVPPLIPPVVSVPSLQPGTSGCELSVNFKVLPGIMDGRFLRYVYRQSVWWWMEDAPSLCVYSHCRLQVKGRAPAATGRGAKCKSTRLVRGTASWGTDLERVRHDHHEAWPRSVLHRHPLFKFRSPGYLVRLNERCNTGPVNLRLT